MEGTATSTTIQNAGKVMVILPKSILQIDTKSISYKLSLFNTSFPWMGLPHIQITIVFKMASSPLLKSMKEGNQLQQTGSFESGEVGTTSKATPPRLR